MEDMQEMSMTPASKLLSSGRAFTLDEPAERKKDKKDKKPSKKGNKQNKSKNSKKPSKSSDFKSCEASCPSMDEMRTSAMEEMKTELCVLNA